MLMNMCLTMFDNYQGTAQLSLIIIKVEQLQIVLRAT